MSQSRCPTAPPRNSSSENIVNNVQLTVYVSAWIYHAKNSSQASLSHRRHMRSTFSGHSVTLMV